MIDQEKYEGFLNDLGYLALKKLDELLSSDNPLDFHWAMSYVLREKIREADRYKSYKL
jgi:hypothetical protein